MSNNDRSRYKAAAGRWIVRVVMIFSTVFFLYPLVWNILASFKTNQEFLSNPFSFPTELNLDNYVRAFTKAKMADYFLNSVFVVVLSTLVLLVFVIPFSYVISRYRFFGSKLITNLYMACIFIQATYIMVPLFLQVNSLGLQDNRVTLGVVYAVLQFPFAIFVLGGFIRSIPKDYEEAARIDGCSNFRILVNVIVPMAKPGIATVAMLSAMGFWNEYPLALVLISSENKKTLPVGLANLFEVQKYATDWSALFAALVIVLIPTVALYLIGQKQLMQGISVGGVKG